MIAASSSAFPALAKGSKEDETELEGFATCLIPPSVGDVLCGVFGPDAYSCVTEALQV